MTNYEKILTLDVSEPDYSKIVFAKQRDNLSRILTVKILINGTPYAYESGDIAVFRYTRPNKTENRAAATIDPATGYVSVVFDNQLLAIEGAIVCDIDISNGDKNLSTPLFFVQNDKSPGKNTQVLPLDEYQILLQTIQEAKSVGTVLGARIDELIAAGTPEGGELIDIRTGPDGTTYQTAGDATRAMAADLAQLLGYDEPTDYNFKLGAIASASGEFVDSSTRIASKKIKVTAGTTVTIVGDENASFSVARYNLDGTYKGQSTFVSWGTSYTVLTDEIIGIIVRKSSSNPTISQGEVPTLASVIQISIKPLILNLSEEIGERIKQIVLAGTEHTLDITSKLAFYERNLTRGGITYTYDNDRGYSFVGTATSLSWINIVSSTTKITNGCMSPGNWYEISFDNSDKNVLLQIYFYDKDHVNIGALYLGSHSLFRVPDNAVYYLLRIRINQGSVVNGTLDNIILKQAFSVLESCDVIGDSESGKVDRTNEIQAMLNNGHCKLGPGIFYVSGNIEMPENSCLEGSGESTILKLFDNVSEGYVVKLEKHCSIRNLKIVGSFADIHNNFTDTIGTRDGIHFTSNYDGSGAGAAQQTEQCFIDGVTIKGFTGSGILCHNTSINYNRGIYVSQTNITDCHTGINIDYYSEFNKFVNVCIAWCYIGCLNGGGNNNFANCTFHATSIGLVIAGGSEHPNNAHGAVSNCTFCHVGSNTGIAIKVYSVGGGYVFTGCQIHYNSIEIENSTGISFNAFQFGRGTTGKGAVININGGNCILFNGCMFANDVNYPPQISITDNTKVIFANCYGAASGLLIEA